MARITVESQGPRASVERETPVDTETTRGVVRRLYEAYVRGDEARVADLIHEDIDWVVYGPIDVFPFAGARRGKAAVLKALAAIARDYELRRYVPEQIVADGDRAAVLSDAAFMQRATGRLLRFRIANFLRFHDGKLIEFREFTDTFDLTQQALGRWLDV
jgi:ketosteroid isomerase-like protein